MKQFYSYPYLPLFLFFASLLIIHHTCDAQASLPKRQTSIQLISDDGVNTVLKFDFGNMKQKSVSTTAGDAVSIGVDQGVPLMQKGFPDLPKVTASIIVPDDKQMSVTILSSHYTDLSDINVAPSKGNLLRTVDPSSIPFNYNNIYSEDIFFPKNVADLDDPYILRDYRGQIVIVYPFQYNAKTKTLRVYSDITVEISPVSSGGKNILVRKNSSTVQTEYNNIYRQQFINYPQQLRYMPLTDRGNMLIICDPDFISAMQPFVDWKIQEGIKTEIVDVSAIGNDATSIKNYVADYYNSKGLTFLLLVGDYAQVVSSQTSAGVSDNDYGYMSGNDHYQEIFVGRFSAESEGEVTTQVNRTIDYEKNPVVGSYYSSAVVVASDQGAGIGDDGEADWEHEQNIRTELLDYTYTGVSELFDGTQTGGNDQPGDPIASDLSSAIDNGVGLVNYTGHGGTSQIATTNFHNSNVNGLTNTDHFPFLWVVGCETGNFKDSLCFAEAWARATYNGAPAGSVANFMSTIDQYWAPPMEAQDEMNAILVESDSENIKRTFGGLSINGCFSMNDKYGQTGYDMTDTWVVFGDPSLEVRTAQPTNMTVTHDPQIFLGSNQFTVNCDLDEAFVALTQSDSIIGTATVSGGVAIVEMSPVLSYDSVTITVTGFNKIPYITKIPVVQSPGPFLVHSAVDINDDSGNGNGEADYNENLGLDLTIENVGASSASGVTSTLATTDPFITITDDSESFSDIESNGSSFHANSFQLSTANDVEDGHQAYFIITSTDALQNVWSSNYVITINAPAVSVGSFTIDDSNGNGDGFLDPGETAMIAISNINDGHSDAENATGTLSTANPFISILSSTYEMGTIQSNSSVTAQFEISVSADAPVSSDLILDYSVTAGSYSANDSFFTRIDPAIEDFETNDFTKFEWELSGNANWFTESDDVYEGNYAARSGDISDNQSSVLEISIDVLYPDSIFFMKKISSEHNYDKLEFYIDGNLKDSWSGYADWSSSSYPVDSGTHIFKWQYKKDGGFSDNADCGWLDYIVLPPFENGFGVGVPSDFFSNISIHPNPFEQLTFIQYSLPKSESVSIKLFDEEGRVVRTILPAQAASEGNYQLGFDGTSLIAGTYLCHIQIGNETFIRKLVIIH